MNEPGLYNRDDIAPTDTEPQEGTEVFEYSMPDEAEVARLVAVLRERSEPTEKQYAVYQIDGHDPCARLARAVELEVFHEYFPSNDESKMQEEYGRFEDCTFLLIVDMQSSKPVGVMRLLRNQPNGLKSIIDIEKPEFEWKKPLSDIFTENDLDDAKLDRAVDVATWGIIKEYQKRDEIRAGLFHALHSYIVANIITDVEPNMEIVTILDDKVRRHLQTFGCHFNDYQGVGSAEYLDSKASTPCHITFREMMDRWQAEQPMFYDYVVNGNGLLDQVEMVVDRPAEA